MELKIETMIIAQTYHSLKEIEDEFWPSLDELLCNEVPSFQWLLQFSESLGQRKSSLYYLFFTNRSNIPIGISQISLLTIDGRKYLPFYQRMWSRLSRRETDWKVLTCDMEGPNRLGHIFNPLYAREGYDYLQKIIKRYSHQNHSNIISEIITYDSEFTPNPPASNEFSYNQLIPHVLHKVYLSYEEYLSSLEQNLCQQIKLKWSEFENNKNFSCMEFNSLKDFWQKMGSSISPGLVPLTNALSIYENSECQFTLFMNEATPQALSVLIPGQGNNLFCQFLLSETFLTSSRENIFDSLFLIQNAIAQFYLLANYQRLIFLPPYPSLPDPQSPLLKIGLTLRNRPTSIEVKSQLARKHWPVIKKEIPWQI